jgi:hypothetical protein
MEILTTISFVAFLLLIYFLPTIIASSRNHRNVDAIFILNLLLGWIILGWIIALIWAMTNDSKHQNV